MEGKINIANLTPVLNVRKIKKDRSLRIDFLEKGRSAQLIGKWLNKIVK